MLLVSFIRSLCLHRHSKQEHAILIEVYLFYIGLTIASHLASLSSYSGTPLITISFRLKMINNLKILLILSPLFALAYIRKV